MPYVLIEGFKQLAPPSLHRLPLFRRKAQPRLAGHTSYVEDACTPGLSTSERANASIILDINVDVLTPSVIVDLFVSCCLSFISWWVTGRSCPIGRLVEFGSLRASARKRMRKDTDMTRYW